MANRQEELTAMLRELRLPTMVSSYAQLALKASKENLTHEGFLYELARLECEERAQRRIERHLLQSKLPREKTFRTFHWERLSASLRLQIERLRSGHFRHPCPQRDCRWSARSGQKSFCGGFRPRADPARSDGLVDLHHRTWFNGYSQPSANCACPKRLPSCNKSRV